MESVTHLMESGETVFIAQNRGETTRFGLFDYQTNTLLYTRDISRSLADAWSYCSKSRVIASLGFENKTVSVYQEVDGSDLSCVTETFAPGASLLVYDKQVRIVTKTLSILSVEGRVLLRTPIPGVFQFDIGIYVVTSVNWKYHFYTKLGELVFTLPRLKSNLVLCSPGDQRLAVAENSGAIQILELTGKPLFKIGVPPGFQAVSLEFSKDGLIFAYHSSLDIHVTAMAYALTVHDASGKLICEERSSYWPGVFSKLLPGWISGNLITSTYRHGTFEAEVIDAVRKGFDIRE